jgi:hypothetical protein
MIVYRMSSSNVRNSIYIPKYYDPQLTAEIEALKVSHECFTVGELIKRKIVSVSSGDELGKSAYGTGDTPFVRTSDISNWEIKTAPKQGVSQQIYEEYADSQDICPGDILLVKDGTYLIGQNCFITSVDKEILYQSHIYKIRVEKPDTLPPELFFLALNSPLVQRQIRAIQFTADIIDTIGQRFFDVVIPIPKSKEVCQALTKRTREALDIRVRGKAFIKYCPRIIEEVWKLTQQAQFISS